MLQSLHYETDKGSEPGLSRMLRKPFMGFTLVELLVAVAIIAILVMIALPNLLEAQTRAKTSGAKSDLRVIASAVETYAVDQRKYPFPIISYKSSLSTVHELSTPVAYLSTSLMRDEFKPLNEDLQPPPKEEWGYAPSYMYNSYAGDFGISFSNRLGVPTFSGFAVSSVGPDRIYTGSMILPFVIGVDPDRESRIINELYDPTNGTVSHGDILRSAGKRVGGAQ